jgi:hypothetical protein
LEDHRSQTHCISQEQEKAIISIHKNSNENHISSFCSPGTVCPHAQKIEPTDSAINKREKDNNNLTAPLLLVRLIQTSKRSGLLRLGLDEFPVEQLHNGRKWSSLQYELDPMRIG